MEGCDLQDKCTFFVKHERSEGMILKCMIKHYCHGSLFKECERRRFFRKVGEWAPEHLIPSGERIYQELNRL